MVPLKTALLGSLSIMVLGMAAEASQAAREALQSARKNAAATRFIAASNDVEQAIRLAGNDPAVLSETYLFKIDLALRQKDWQTASATAREIIAHPNLPLEPKLAALKKLSQHLKAEKKYEEQKALYEEALQNRELIRQGAEAPLCMALGQIYESGFRLDKAEQLFRKAAETGSAANQMEALKHLGRVLTEQTRYAEARSVYETLIAKGSENDQVAGRIEVARTYEAEGLPEPAEQVLQDAAANYQAHPAARAKILAALVQFYRNRGDYPRFREALHQLRQTASAIDSHLLRQAALFAEERQQFADARQAWEEMIAGSRAKTLPDEPVRRLLALLADQGDSEALKAFLAQLDFSKLSPVSAGVARLLTVVLSTSSPQVPDLAPLTPEQRIEVCYETARLAMRLRQYDIARLLAKTAEGMLEAAPQPVYHCAIMGQAPTDVSAWENSEIVRDPAKREARFQEYNKKAAALLVNDVNVVREVSAESTLKQAPASIYMAADKRGWHVYIRYLDPEAEAVLAGIKRGHTLELYTSPGLGECYHQMLLDIPDGRLRFANWSSPYKGYRSLEGHLAVQVAPIEGGFGIYLCFPWERFYDKLPDDESVWPFGCIVFGRDGAFVWGSGQVHDIHRFGRVRFSGIERIRPEIERWIVMKAYGSYLGELPTQKLLWDDPEKGDPEFYSNVLLPYFRKLDELGKLVTPEMNSSAVAHLFKSAVPEWMELPFQIAELRQDYLTNRLFKK